MSDDIPSEFSGFIYEPSKEQEVVSIFFRILPHLDLPICIEEVRGEFPDCLAWIKSNGGYERLNIEFEIFSRNFLEHDHDEKECDLIVCWKDDWPECSVETLELKKELKDLEKELILKDEAKYKSQVWSKRDFLQKVDENYPEIFDLQEKIYRTLESRESVNIRTGKGSNPTYHFRIPSTDHKANLGIYANGRTWIGFKKLSDEGKRNLASALRNKLDINIDSEKDWTKGPHIGEDITKENIDKFLSIVSHSEGI
ncbi:hypothetical protein AKJ37_04225 [candidate division MSBL1 archaeon SCGC-AAA259I09]|uniref:Uncharacterized protein n=1 Tax=candidate division MSBL1 archaeon SCGC-AAA259I09 TaxID=1698267 RepID=A0A133URX0_9EURY|nr:hypothetical protein AKJ37_04225 [candidate division MSBL1 archaeon SCGC-AAA259I09]